MISKKILFTFLVLSFNSYSQFVIENISLIDKSDRVVYKGVTNRLNIKVNSSIQEDSVDLVLVSSNGNFLRKISPRSYKYSINTIDSQPKSFDTLYVLSELNDSIYGYSVFEIKPIGPLNASLGYLKDSLISKSELSKIKTIKLYHEYSNFNPTAKIDSVIISFCIKGEKNIFEPIKGSKLKSKHTNLLKKLNHGDKIIIEKVFVSEGNSRGRIISKIIYTVF